MIKEKESEITLLIYIYKKIYRMLEREIELEHMETVEELKKILSEIDNHLEGELWVSELTLTYVRDIYGRRIYEYSDAHNKRETYERLKRELEK
jgi:hypothetical protein